MVIAPPPTRDSAVLFASMAVQLSCTGMSHHSLLPHIPLICLSTVNSSPHPGIAPQSLHDSSQQLHLPGHLLPAWGMCGYSKDYLILIPFGLPQISCFTLSLHCFSSNSDNCPNVGIRPLFLFPHPPPPPPPALPPGTRPEAQLAPVTNQAMSACHLTL